MTSMLIKDYYAITGSRYTKEDAEIIGPQLVELSRSGKIDPGEVVEVARSENSPLHRYFEWDDKKAAELYRVDQASTMIRSIKVKVVDRGTEKITSPVKLSKPVADRDSPRDFVVLSGDRAVAVHMMRNAIKELTHWRERYEQHQDDWERLGTALVTVFAQINECEAECDQVGTLSPATDTALAELLAWRDKHTPTNGLWASMMEQMRFMHEAISDAEHAFSYIEGKHTRKCMACKTEFISDGPGNRLCDKCRTKASAIDEVAL